MARNPSSSQGQYNAEDVELSKVNNKSLAESAEKVGARATNDNQADGVNIKPRSESDNAEGQEKQQGKEEDKSDHGDNADGFDPFSQQTFGPLMSGNQYSMRKTASQALMDVALMMANISQLRTLLTAGDDIDYSVVLIVMVALSLAFQLLFAILIFIIWMRESEQHQKDEFLRNLRAYTEKADGTSAAVKTAVRDSILRRQTSYQGHRLTSHLNYVTMVLVFIITVINMFITGFGIKLQASTDSSTQTNSSS